MNFFLLHFVYDLTFFSSQWECLASIFVIKNSKLNKKEEN